jgi:hypothetical protein
MPEDNYKPSEENHLEYALYLAKRINHTFDRCLEQTKGMHDDLRRFNKGDSLDGKMKEDI